MVPDIGNSIDAQVNKDNRLTLQIFDLNQYARQLDVSSGVGSVGSAIVSLTCKFYEIVAESSPRFEITHEYVDPCKGFLRSKICLSYIARPGDEESNMVTAKITLISGFTYDPDTPKTPEIKVSLF